MQTVYKYQLLDMLNRIEMPVGAKILHVAYQGKDFYPYIWALVSTEVPKVERYIKIVGTGFDCQYLVEEEDYIGTITRDGFVWHVFDLGEVH